jgi:hypothetical protein
MRQLATAHGDADWHANAFPLSVDGVEIVASLVLLADRRAGRASGWLPWAALATGTAASLAANVATAGPGTTSQVIADRPAVALLIAVKLLSGILEHRTADAAAGDETHPAGLSPVPVPAELSGSTARHPRPARPRASRPRPTARRDDHAHGGTAPADATGLEHAARAVRDELRRDGQPLTRDALAARLRATGHPVRLTPLLAALQAEPAAMN